MATGSGAAEAAVPFRDLAERFSIRVRLAVLAAAGSALVLAAGATMMYGSLTSTIDASVTAEMRVRADDVAAEVRAGPPVAVAGSLQTQVVRVDGTVLSPAGATPLLAPAEVAAAGRAELVVDRSMGTIDDARILARPAQLVDGTPVVVIVAGTTATLDEARDRLLLVLGIAGPVLVSAMAGAAWLLTGAALRPVGRMTRRAATISLAEPGSRLPEPPGRDELAELGHTLNEMLGRIEATLAHERAFVDNASHELRSPLAVLRGELELLRVELLAAGSPSADPDVIAGIDSALEEVDRLSRLATHLLVLARLDAGDRTHGEAPLRSVVRSVLDRLPRPDRLTVDVDIDESTQVPLTVDDADQVMSNLLSNALRHAEHQVTVRATRDGTTGVVVEVTDDGAGFDPAIAATAFDRFVRADVARARGGTGLGLAIVDATVRSAGGRCEIRPGTGHRGTTLRLTFP